MANYVAFVRSNYFKVKDLTAFEQFCEKWDLRLISDEEKCPEESPLYGFLVECSEAGIPSIYYDTEKEDYVDGDFLGELSNHLVDGWVAIVMEVGYEKMRYLIGFAVAINEAGERFQVSLGDIYDKAKSLGRHITDCEY